MGGGLAGLVVRMNKCEAAIAAAREEIAATTTSTTSTTNEAVSAVSVKITEEIEKERAARVGVQRETEGTLAELVGTIEAIKTEMGSSMNTIKSDMEKVVQTIKTEMGTSMETIKSDMETEMGAEKQRWTGIQQETEGTLAELVGTIEAMKAEVTERGSSRTKEVSDFVDQLRKEVQDLKGDVETQKQAGADVAVNIARAQTQVDALSKEMSSHVSASASTSSVVATLQTQVEHLEREMKAVEDVSNQLTDCQTKLEQLQGESRREMEKTVSRDIFTPWQTKVEDLSKQLQQAVMHDDAYGTFQANVEDLSKRVREGLVPLESFATLEGRVEALSVSKDGVSTQLQVLQAKWEEVAQEMDSMRSRVTSEEKKEKEKEKEKDASFSSSVSALSTQLHDLQTIVSAHQSRRDRDQEQTEATLVDLVSAIEVVKQDVTTLRTDVVDLSTTTAKKSSEKNEKDQADDQQRRMELELRMQEIAREEVSDVVRDATGQIQDLKQEVQTVREWMETVETSRADPTGTPEAATLTALSSTTASFTALVKQVEASLQLQLQEGNQAREIAETATNAAVSDLTTSLSEVTQRVSRFDLVGTIANTTAEMCEKLRDELSALAMRVTSTEQHVEESRAHLALAATTTTTTTTSSESESPSRVLLRRVLSTWRAQVSRRKAEGLRTRLSDLERRLGDVTEQVLSSGGKLEARIEKSIEGFQRDAEETARTQEEGFRRLVAAAVRPVQVAVDDTSKQMVRLSEQVETQLEGRVSNLAEAVQALETREKANRSKQSSLPTTPTKGGTFTSNVGDTATVRRLEAEVEALQRGSVELAEALKEIEDRLERAPRVPPLNAAKTTGEAGGGGGGAAPSRAELEEIEAAHAAVRAEVEALKEEMGRTKMREGFIREVVEENKRTIGENREQWEMLSGQFEATVESLTELSGTHAVVLGKMERVEGDIRKLREAEKVQRDELKDHKKVFEEFDQKFVEEFMPRMDSLQWEVKNTKKEQEKLKARV